MKTLLKPSSNVTAAKIPPVSRRIHQKGCVKAWKGLAAPWGQAYRDARDMSG